VAKKPYEEGTQRAEHRESEQPGSRLKITSNRSAVLNSVKGNDEWTVIALVERLGGLLKYGYRPV
jgi:hypothetical protein